MTAHRTKLEIESLRQRCLSLRLMHFPIADIIAQEHISEAYYHVLMKHTFEKELPELQEKGRQYITQFILGQQKLIQQMKMKANEGLTSKDGKAKDEFMHSRWLDLATKKEADLCRLMQSLGLLPSIHAPLIDARQMTTNVMINREDLIARAIEKLAASTESGNSEISSG